MSTKRILSLVLAFVMVLGTFGTVFADVATKPTENDKVNTLIELGLVKGDGNDYRLNDAITRQEVATMLVRMLGFEKLAADYQNQPSIFTDVTTGAWNNGYVLVAAMNKLTNGVGEGKFAPERQVTNAEVITMLVRAAGLEGDVNGYPFINYQTAMTNNMLEGLEDLSLTALSTRENVFEMVYNTLDVLEAGTVVNTVQGIVIENYRTESLDKNEVVVHVLKDAYKYEQGEEYALEISSGFDVEDLLGKVVTIGFDENDNVVKVDVDNSYDYLQGSLSSIKENSLKLNNKQYTVEKAEAKVKVYDERLFQVYVNNDDVHYINSDDELISAEYAKVTVKNGKVIFIDAYDFTDVAPVSADVESNVISYFDDSNNGDIAKITKADSAYVLNISSDSLTVGNYEEINKNDVIHFYKDNNGKTTIFVSRNIVEGEFEDASAKKAKDADTVYISVDGKEYPALVKDDSRDAVYSNVSSSLEFVTLTEDYDVELKIFEDKEVVLVLDMFGNVQLIGSETVNNTFYAIVTNTDRSQGEIKLYTFDNNDEWFATNRKTAYSGFEIEKTDTRDKQFDVFTKYDLVKVTAEEGVVTSLERIETTEDAVTTITKNVIDFSNIATPVAGEDFYYVSKSAKIVVAIPGKTFKVMDMATFLKDYYDPADSKYVAADHEIVAYVADVTKGDVANIIVVTDATSIGAENSAKVAEVTRVRFSGKKYWLDVTFGDNTSSRHEVTGNVYKVNDTTLSLGGVLVEAGDIVKLTMEKTDAQNIIDIENVVLEASRKVVKYGYDTARKENFVQFKDAPEKVWISSSGDAFGDISVGSWVQYTALDKYNTTSVIVEVDGPKAPTTPSDLLEAVLEVEGKVLVQIEGKLYQYAGAASDVDPLIGKVVTYKLQVVNGVQYIYNINEK